MTYDIYAVYPEASYLVASSTDVEHGLDFASKVLKELNITPFGFAAIGRGVHTISGELCTLSDLKAKV